MDKTVNLVSFAVYWLLLCFTLFWPKKQWVQSDTYPPPPLFLPLLSLSFFSSSPSLFTPPSPLFLLLLPLSFYHSSPSLYIPLLSISIYPSSPSLYTQPLLPSKFPSANFNTPSPTLYFFSGALLFLCPLSSPSICILSPISLRYLELCEMKSYFTMGRKKRN